ncbi:hypothetical protein K3495_g5606 [Podosphaera aphanis]|nr:hypothetical protein K3495_g5606 [Podosphaera aphanis]
MAQSKFYTLVAVLALSSTPANSHGHDMSKIVTGEIISTDPIDSILWVHILLMTLSFGIIFPTGLVLGMVRNRWHVPTQVVGTTIAVPAYFLGHMHKGRIFTANIHSVFANWLMLILVVQIALGTYLRLHLTRGIHSKIRRTTTLAHGTIGKIMPLVAWTQMLFGGITALGFCRKDHFGQCLAHFIMGSAFIGYGIFMTIIMLGGQFWLQRRRRSPEFFDSVMIASWGCVNTFTEHRWGEPWSGNDIQHTSMGIIWWTAGLVGIWLSRKRSGAPKRNVIPGFVIFITGWAMSAHPQHLPLSTMIHTVFGYTLMAAGLTRIIEVSFVLRDQNTVSEEGDANSFQFIPPFLLIASGFIFMSATEEQMKLASDAGITHVSYVLVLFSFASIMFLFVNLLIHLYGVLSVSSENNQSSNLENHPAKARGHIRDAEEFELEDLMDEYDVPDSPSTLGKNEQGLAH